MFLWSRKWNQFKISLQNDGRKEPFYVKQLSFDDLNELAENFYEN